MFYEKKKYQNCAITGGPIVNNASAVLSNLVIPELVANARAICALNSTDIPIVLFKGKKKSVGSN